MLQQRFVQRLVQGDGLLLQSDLLLLGFDVGLRERRLLSLLEVGGHWWRQLLLMLVYLHQLIKERLVELLLVSVLLVLVLLMLLFVEVEIEGLLLR